MTVKELKRGDFFRLSENGRVYVRDEYDRAEKKYWIYPFDDVNAGRFLKGSRAVLIDFEF